MTKILALDHKTDRLTAELNNLGEKLFWLDEHNQEKAGAHSFTFTMPAGIKEAKAFGKRARFLIPLEENGFQEFIVFKSTTFNKIKEIKGTAAYSEMETDYIVEPGTYTGTVEELANLVLPFTDYVLGVFEDIRIRTIYVKEHTGAYSFLTKIASAFDLEMHFRSEVAGTRFTGRYVDYVKKVGADLKKEVVYGVDLIDMKMTVHDDRIATALIGIGPEREDGTRLTSYIENEDAFQRWNRKGRHITRIYRPDSDRQDMSQAELDQYTETELTKRIASVVEYEITAASVEREFPHAKVRYGSTLRVKNPTFNPPLYANARVIGVRRSIADPSKKTYVIGEVKTYTEDEIYKTFRQLQAQYNLRVIRSPERPPGSPNKIWIQTNQDSDVEIPHVWSTQLNDWVKIAPTTAAEIGAETPQGAQYKADAAEGNAKDYAESLVGDSETALQEFVQTYAQRQVAQDDVPPAEPLVGDLWIDTSSGSPVWKRWDGVGWDAAVKTSLAELSGVLQEDQLTDEFIKTRHIAAESITSEMIVALGLDAAVIKFGTMSGERILANTITADHLAVDTLSAVSADLGDVTAGTISGVTFLSQAGKKSFKLSNGLAEFIEDRSLQGITLGTRTAINEDGITVQYTYYDTVEHASSLNARSLFFRGEGAPYTEYGLDKIELLADSISEFGIYPNWQLTTIQSSGALDLVAGSNKLSLASTNLVYNGKVIAFSSSEVLWEGGWLAGSSGSVVPTRKLADCPNGWKLVWSRYVNGAPADSDWNVTVIPKVLGGHGGGTWHEFPATGSSALTTDPPKASKYMYASGTTITGHDRNTAGTQAGQCLRYVLAY